MNFTALRHALVVFVLSLGAPSFFLFVISGWLRIILAIGLLLFATNNAIKEFQEYTKKHEHTERRHQ